MTTLTKRKRRALERGPVTAACLSCPWTATGSTWRPVKRRLTDHTTRFHRDIAA